MIDTRFYNHLGPVPITELLSALDVKVGEDNISQLLIYQAAPVDQAGASMISYFEKTRRRPSLEHCGASACFVHDQHADMIKDLGCIPIKSKFPRADFARVSNQLYTIKPYNCLENAVFKDVGIGRNTVIGAGASIGQNTQIGANSVIGPGVVIGENCVIGANVVIEFSYLGNNCKIHHGAVIGGTGFGVAQSEDGGIDIPHFGIVRIGNNVSVGCQTTIDRAMFGETIIGNGCKFDNQVQIGHNNHIGTNCMFAAHTGISGSCTIGNGVIMGGKAGVADHINIGDGASMAANAATMHDIPAGEFWSGYPAMPIRQHMRQVSALRKMVKPKPK